MNPSRNFSSFSNSPAVFLLFPPSSFSSQSFPSDFPSLLPAPSSALILLTSLGFLSFRWKLRPSEFFGRSPRLSSPPSLHLFLPLSLPTSRSSTSFHASTHSFIFFSSLFWPFSSPSFFKFSLFSVFPFNLPPPSLSLALYSWTTSRSCSATTLPSSHMCTLPLTFTPLRLVFEGGVLWGFVRSAAVWQFDTHMHSSTATYAAECSLPAKTLRRLSVYQLYISFTHPALCFPLFSHTYAQVKGQRVSFHGESANQTVYNTPPILLLTHTLNLDIKTPLSQLMWVH